jgi:Fe-S-cluster containining protein
MSRHFGCTVCGKCCVGWLPLALPDALKYAHLFPLAVLWRTVRQGSKAFGLAGKLGLAFDRKTALLITPVSYLPPDMPCPALSQGLHCAIHADKPLRCRAMPFSAEREEGDQADLLIPRKGWLCDVSAAAPAVYRDGVLLGKADFDAERQALLEQAPLIRAYAETLLKRSPALAGEIEKLTRKTLGGQLVLKISPLLRKVPGIDLKEVAARQAGALKNALSSLPLSADYDDYRKNYADWLSEMESLSAPKETGA